MKYTMKKERMVYAIRYVTLNKKAKKEDKETETSSLPAICIL